MLIPILQFFFFALIIVAAGSFLTKFTDKISDETGWGRMFVGMILLAGATSLPELMVDLKAIKLNLPDLAVGDLLGSCLFNLLILSILDFSFPSAFRRTAFSPQFLHHSLSAVLTIVLTSIVGVGITSGIDTSFLGMSIFSWALLVTYFFGTRLIYLEGKLNLTRSENPKQQKLIKFKLTKPLALAFLGYVSSAVVIALAAPYLVNSADEIAKLSQLGHTFIGTTLVALATSLPELVATFAAFRMGAPDLALGNIFGSNAFNMLLLVPLDAFSPKVLFSSVGSVHAVTAFSVVTVMSIAVMGQLYRKKERSRFSEPSSEIVVFVILTFLFLLYKIKSP